MKTNSKNSSSAKSAQNANKVSSESSNQAKQQKQPKQQPTAATEKMIAYADARKQRIAERYTLACQFSTTKASTANVVNSIATANTFNAISVDTLCGAYVSHVKSLKNELPKELVGLLKKYGCETIRAQVNDNNLAVFVDARANVNVQALVRLVCRFNKDIADILRNVRAEQKQKQSKGANKAK